MKEAETAATSVVDIEGSYLHRSTIAKAGQEVACDRGHRCALLYSFCCSAYIAFYHVYMMMAVQSKPGGS